MNTRKRTTVVAPSVTAPTAPTLTAPAEGADVYDGVGVTVSATVTAGQVPDRIDFVLDPGVSEVVVATDSTSPYSQTWTPSGVTAGAHTLVARFVYGSGSVDSAAVNIVLFDPTVITGLLQWTNARTGFAPALWEDQGPEGNDLVQATGVWQAAYNATALNGGPAVVFDGTAAWMGSDGNTLTAHVTGTDKAYTICQATQNTEVNNRIWYSFTEDGGNSRDFFYNSGTTSLAHNRVDDAGGVFGGALSVTVDDAAHRYIMVYSGTGSELFEDNVSVGSVSCDSGACTFNWFSLCCERNNAGVPGSFSAKKLGEHIIYDHALSPTNRGRVDAYLAAKNGF